MKGIKINHILDQVYMTINLKDAKDIQGISASIKAAYDYLYENDIYIVYQKCFANEENKDTINSIQKLMESNQTPHIDIFISLESVSHSPAAGVFIYGIAHRNISNVHYYQSYETQIVTFVHDGLTYMHGTIATEMPDKMFEACESNMLRMGFLPNDILRTWFYIYRISDTYIEFNSLRNQFFERNNIEYSNNSNNLPASTCIEGSISGKNVMHFLGVRGNYPSVTRLYNTMQNEADGNTYLYAPAFSRALALNYNSYLQVQLSGTASIGKKGETLFVADRYNQIKQTLQNIMNLLKRTELDISNMCEYTLFFKNEEVYLCFDAVCNELGISLADGIFVYSNVCRDDLLFEMDGIALQITKD